MASIQVTSRGYTPLTNEPEHDTDPPAYTEPDETPPLLGNEGKEDQDVTDDPPPPYPGFTGSPGYTQVYIPPETSTYTTQPVEDATVDSVEEGGFSAASSFSDRKVRQAFIRKVYLILMVQLLVTFGIVCLFIFCKPVNDFVTGNPSLVYASYGVFIVCMFSLACCNEMRRKFPLNLIMLGVFTLALSYMVGTISCFYTTKSVLLALGICAGVCLSVTVFSIQTKYDFTSCVGILFAVLMAFFWFGFFCIFFYSEILQVVYAGIGAVIFTVILAVDTQLVMGGKRYQITPEEYIFAALNLYVDIVYIFLYILALFGGGRN
ncbi:protein lifeguard 2-like [Glandiceps talaboti]